MEVYIYQNNLVPNNWLLSLLFPLHQLFAFSRSSSSRMSHRECFVFTAFVKCCKGFSHKSTLSIITVLWEGARLGICTAILNAH